MYQRRTKRFRRRSNGRHRQGRSNGEMNPRLGSEHYSNDPKRNHFRTTQSAEKLFEKYNMLAREALASGDKTLSENYFQHADHFMRVIKGKNENQSQNIKAPTEDKTIINKNIDSNKPASDSSPAAPNTNKEEKI